MNDLFLIARIADEVVALPTAGIGSVVEIDEIAPVPRVAPHIAGLFALRSRVLTVIDTRTALGLGAIRRERGMTAVIIDTDGHSYALLVDEVEDVVEARAMEPCPALIEPAWVPVARGTIRLDERAILVVAPEALVAGQVPLAA